jgi:hypothetical protein
MGTESRLRLPNEVARAEELYRLATTDEEFETYRERCPVDRWLIDHYGLTFEEQANVGRAFAQTNGAWGGDVLDPIAQEWVEALLTALGLEARSDAALSVLSSTVLVVP